MSDGNGNDLVVMPRREVRVVEDMVAVMDTAKFEHMQRIATVMAETSTIPDSLRFGKRLNEAGKMEDFELPSHRVVANCFRVVNQAFNWKMDPFAVCDCASIVHGKLMWEGKLVAAVIDANLGVRLTYTFTDTDKPLQGRALGVIVSGTIPGEKEPRTIEGTVADWHKGDKSPWSNPGINGNTWKRQLRYMGAREWARAHSPSVMLGVITIDEAGDSFERPPRQIAQSRRAIAITAAATDIPEETTEQAAPAGTAQVEPVEPAAKQVEPAAKAAPAKPADDAIPEDDDWPGPKDDAALIDDLTAALAKHPATKVEALFAERIKAAQQSQREQAIELLEKAKKRR